MFAYRGKKWGRKKFTCLKGRSLCTEWKKIWLPERKSAYKKEKKIIAWERSLPTCFKKPACFKKKHLPARIRLANFSARCWKAKCWNKVCTHYFCCYHTVKTRPSINFCTIDSLVLKSTMLYILLSRQSWQVKVLWEVLIFSSFLYGFKKGTDPRSYSSLTRHNMKFSCAFEVIALNIID